MKPIRKFVIFVGVNRKVRVIEYQTGETLEKARATEERVENTVRLLEEEQIPRLRDLQNLNEEEIRQAHQSGAAHILE